MSDSASPHLIDSLSSQSISGCNWLQRVQFAGKVIFGATSLALVTKCAEGEYRLAGLVSADGVLRLVPPENLEYFGVGAPLASLNNLKFIQQPLSDARQADFHLPDKHAYFLPWFLGIEPSYSFVLFGVEPPQAAVRESLSMAFSTVANNLLRRAMKKRLMDAGAWIESEIEKLANLQNLLQPSNLEMMDGVSFAVHSRPHAYAGGDYYDIAQIDTQSSGRCDRCLISVADVSGHGPAAVVETAMIDSILRTFSDARQDPADRGPAQVMNYLNRHMFTRRPRPSFATMFTSEWNARDSVLKYCLAGHPPPLLKSKKTGVCTTIDRGEGIPLQILRNYQWSELELEITAGDMLVVYSDGITEALSSGGNQFCLNRLQTAVTHGPDDPADMLNHILTALNTHTDEAPIHDDQTIVIAKFE